MSKGLLLDGSTYEELNLENSIYDITKFIIENIGKYAFIVLYSQVLKECKSNQCLLKTFINFMIAKSLISKEIIEKVTFPFYKASSPNIANSMPMFSPVRNTLACNALYLIRR